MPPSMFRYMTFCDLSSGQAKKTVRRYSSLLFADVLLEVREHSGQGLLLF